MLGLVRRAANHAGQAVWLCQLSRKGVVLGRNVRLHGSPECTLAKGSHIALGNNVVLSSTTASTALGVMQPVVLRTLLAGARLSVGEDTGISGAVICAASHVSIGARVLIGSGVVIADTDFHPLDLVPRRFAPLPEPSPAGVVSIEDDVFVGARAIILKGSTVGRGSVIGAGSVVSGTIPEGVVAAGNPAKVIRRLRDWESQSAR